MLCSTLQSLLFLGWGIVQFGLPPKHELATIPDCQGYDYIIILITSMSLTVARRQWSSEVCERHDEDYEGVWRNDLCGKLVAGAGEVLSRHRKLPLKYPFNVCLSMALIQYDPMISNDCGWPWLISWSCGERELFVFYFFRGCSASGFRSLKAFAIQTFRSESYSIMRGLPGSAGFLGPGQAYRLQQTYILQYCSVLLELTWSSFQYCTALVL